MSVCVCVLLHEWHSVSVEVRSRLTGVSSVLTIGGCVTELGSSNLAERGLVCSAILAAL